MKLTEQSKPMSATEVTERQKKFGAEIQAMMCKLIQPVILETIQMIEKYNNTKEQ